jgi:DoxX-like family
MSLATHDPHVSKGSLWAGRVVTALIVLFMLFDSAVKVLKLAPAMEGTIKLGYPASVVFPLGVVLLACTVLYAIPRTAILGAILLTGYLGGAVATEVRVQSASFWFAVLFGVLVWLGIYLRDSQLRALIPLRTP